MTALNKFNLVLIVIIAFAAGEMIGNRGAIHGYGLRCGATNSSEAR